MNIEQSLTVKLVQLPIPEVQYLYTQGNIPLASGYLKTNVVRRGVMAPNEIQLISRRLANFGGDAAILDWIKKDNTNIVGFTCYMWNIERNIYLAEKIKEESPNTIIVFGGPEIDQNHWALKNKFIDTFIIGEGEEAFIKFLQDLKYRRHLKRFYDQIQPIDLKKIFNPYLDKVLTPEINESMFFETMRGCPYTCKYCYYSKSYSHLRFFPDNYLPKLFKIAQDYKVPEIYLMDPSFNMTPQLKTKLEYLRRLNTTDIPLHTEMRLESITPNIAKQMKEAGFRSIEAGLQSVNYNSLKAIGRTWNKEKFIQGANLLLEQGIDCKVGMILGLPEDQLEDLERTIDFVSRYHLTDSLEIYPLSIIPGSMLRTEASILGINYMPHPPYWVTSNRHLKEKDFKFAIELIENKLDIEFFPPIIPLFKNLHSAFFHFLDLRNNKKLAAQLKILYKFPERLGHSITLIISETNDLSHLFQLGKWLKKVNPFSLIQVVMDYNSFPPSEVISQLNKFFSRPQHYFNNIHHYKVDSQENYALRFFHLTANLKIAESYLYSSHFCDLILKYSPTALTRGKEILEEKPLLLIDTPISNEEYSQLQKIYNGFENFLIFSSSYLPIKCKNE